MSISISKSDLDDFFTRLEGLESEKKSIADEMKDSVASFASNYELNKKSVNKAFKDWKQAKADRDQFCLIDLEADQLLITVFPELGTGTDQEDED